MEYSLCNFLKSPVTSYLDPVVFSSPQFSQILSTYVNTHCLIYKNKSVNGVQGTFALCSEVHTKHTNTLCGQM